MQRSDEQLTRACALAQSTPWGTTSPRQKIQTGLPLASLTSSHSTKAEVRNLLHTLTLIHWRPLSRQPGKLQP